MNSLVKAYLSITASAGAMFGFGQGSIYASLLQGSSLENLGIVVGATCITTVAFPFFVVPTALIVYVKSIIDD